MKAWASAFFFLSLSSALAAELVKGKRYDFYQTNGQNVVGAELVDESDTDYTVKLRYLSKPLRISKKNLIKPPRDAAIENQPARPALRWGKELRLNTLVGYTPITLGPLREIFPSGFHAGVGADWHIFMPPRWGVRALSVLGVFSQYMNQPRFIREVGLLAGPQFLLFASKERQLSFTASALTGVAYVSLRGYTFASQYAVFAAMGALRAEKSVGPVVIGLQVMINYLFDESLNFFSTGLGLSVQYALSSH